MAAVRTSALSLAIQFIHHILSQVTYVANDTSDPQANQFIYEVSLVGQTLQLFTHSFLGYGQDAAMHLSLTTSALQLSGLEKKVGPNLRYKWQFIS